MKRLFANFTKAEDGNAVIDWVVLMAGIVLLAISVVLTIAPTLDTITDETTDQLQTMEGFHSV